MTASLELSTPSIQGNALPLTAMPAAALEPAGSAAARPAKRRGAATGKRARKPSRVALAVSAGGVLAHFPADTD
jgi:hypothetical protein